MKKQKKKKKITLEWIECMSYSPDNTMLAVGSHDNNIYIFDATKKYKLKEKLTGHSSFITCLDWSQGSDWIRSNCGAYELLFFTIAKGKWKREPKGASNTVETIWAD
jgi:WD40 repeat protein